MAAPKITWAQALGWRMRRQYLDPVGDRSLTEVVRRLCGIQAQVASSAELGIRVRRVSSKPGEVARALREGRLIKTWAMRGTLHLLTPEDAGTYLALIAAGRSWERPSWERAFGVTPAQIERLRAVVRDALAERPLTREELGAAVTAHRGFGHVGEALRSGWGTLLKPLAWQGDLCFGPSQGNRVTFTCPAIASPRWAGVPDLNEAAPLAISAYLQSYGPATANSFANWLSRGRVSKKALHGWFGKLGERVAEVDVEGERAYVLAADLDELVSTKPTRTVRLLPGFDQFVLGPGTDDGHVIAPRRRSAVSRQSGWIAPVVLTGGVVSGTWVLESGTVTVEWFGEAGRAPRTSLQAEVTRLAAIVGRDLALRIGAA